MAIFAHCNPCKVVPIIGFFKRFLPCSEGTGVTVEKIEGSDNRIEAEGAVLHNVTFDIAGSHNRIHIGENARLNHVKLFIRGDHHTIHIGDSCQFRRGGNLWFEDHHCSLTIGSGSTFEDVHIAVTEPYSAVTIGRDCMLAYDIDIRTGDSHSVISAESGKRLNYAQNIAIGDHVWIAAHAIVLKGVTLPDHCIVATGSVVAKGPQSPGTIMGGNPAKPIKEHITWDRRRINDR